MSANDFLSLLPLEIVAATAILVLLGIAAGRRHGLSALLTCAGLAGAWLSVPLASSISAQTASPLFAMDRFAGLIIAIVLSAGFAVTLLSYEYLKTLRSRRPEEFYVLLLLAVLGGMTLAAARHFAALFLGFELLSVPLYVLIAYTRPSDRGLEAGMKYLLLAGSSSAFLLFGMALLYAERGTMFFAGPPLAGAKNPVLLAGFALMLAGIGFKLALVPFHMWTPDVYEGAPPPVAAFIATVSKGAMAAVLLRFVSESGALDDPLLRGLLAAVSAASMLVGNGLALFQNNVKRILAYSSISQLGYLIVAVLAGGALAGEAVVYFLAAYSVTMLGAFGVVTVLSGADREPESLDDYRGLFARRPALAGVFAAMLLSLAGIPLTGGFVGKFYLIAAGVDGALITLVVLLVVTSVIGLFYYLRVVAALFAKAPDGAEAGPPLSFTNGIVLAALTILLLWLGLYPAPLMQLAQSALAVLG